MPSVHRNWEGKYATLFSVLPFEYYKSSLEHYNKSVKVSKCCRTGGYKCLVWQWWQLLLLCSSLHSNTPCMLQMIPAAGKETKVLGQSSAIWGKSQNKVDAWMDRKDIGLQWQWVFWMRWVGEKGRFYLFLKEKSKDLIVLITEILFFYL